MEKEWEKEPNFLEWNFNGLHCIINRTMDFGHLCGYVGVNKDHPLYKEQYRNLEVHGGITYIGNEMHFMNKDLFYFGFDCGHAFDATPFFTLFNNAGKVYRNIEYVKENVESLAEQLYYHKYLLDELINGGE